MNTSDESALAQEAARSAVFGETDGDESLLQLISANDFVIPAEEPKDEEEVEWYGQPPAPRLLLIEEADDGSYPLFSENTQGEVRVCTPPAPDQQPVDDSDMDVDPAERDNNVDEEERNLEVKK